MKGLFVVLLCATVGFCVKGNPLPAEDDSTVESAVVRESKELPLPGRFSGGFVKPQTRINPFLSNTEQLHTKHVHVSGRLINQKTKVLPVDSHVQTEEKITSKNAETHEKDIIPHEEPIEIVSQNSDLYPDGSHFNVWESANGIKVQEEGMVKINGKDEIPTVTGSFSYTDPEGNPINLSYTADENGFQPQGDHLPTPPPIPQSVIRALEYIAAHPWIEEDHVKSPSDKQLMKEELPTIEVV